jgi:propionate CoA-transferase
MKEVAPGIDIDRYILPQMDFQPEIADDIDEMDSRIFREEKIEIIEGIIHKDE